MPRYRSLRLLFSFLLVFAVVVAFRYRDWWQGAEQRVLEVDEQHIVLDGSEGGYSRHIIAVGDLHSDYGNALKVLKMAGVVDAKGNWSGRIDLFVQTGDIIDRYESFFDGIYKTRQLSLAQRPWHHQTIFMDGKAARPSSCCRR